MTNSDGNVILPIGPQHPSLKEPAGFRITLEGEEVRRAQIELGYNHRGLEKACESRSYVQDLYLIERVCGICSHAHTATYCRCVEALCGLEVPRRAEYIRGVVGELERLHSHLLWLGVAGHEIGFDTLFMYTWRDRESVMETLAELGGNRVNYGVNTIGGVRRDLDDGLRVKIGTMLDGLEPRIAYYRDLALTESTLAARLAGIGRLDKEDAAHYGAVGPVARAAGIADDVRAVEPYGVFRELKVNVVTDDHADVYGRTLVRVGEMLESVRLIRAMLEALPEGPIVVKAPRKVPAGEVICRCEAPRGEDVHYLRSLGGEKPDRVRVRAPSEANWHGMRHMLEQNHLADVPIIIAAIDPCYSCTDRAITLAEGAGSRVTDWESLRQAGIAWYQARGVDPSAIGMKGLPSWN